jgi:hypothetical protein
LAGQLQESVSAWNRFLLFFGAAFLISLFGAAAALPAGKAKTTAISFLVWLTVAGLYWIVGGIGPLVALSVGTVVSGTCWALTFLVAPSAVMLSIIWEVVPMSFVWGIVFSVIVVLSRILWHVARWARGRLRSQSPFCQDAKPVLSAWGVARQIVFTRLFLSMLLVLAAIIVPWCPWWAYPIPRDTSRLIDSPLEPIIVSFFPDLFGSSNPRFILLTPVLYCPLYAGTGWLLGLILVKMSRRADIPAANQQQRASRMA